MAQTSMTAAVIHKAGGPEALQIENVPVPEPREGQVLIRIKASGMNRSELFTRQGHSGDIVKFPRILGIEACGVVAKCPGGEFQQGDVVVTAMGGIGRVFDGGYAEYTCPPAKQVVKVETTLDWKTLGAVPEMLQTAWGSLFRSLQLKKEDHLLVRGGTTSIGLAAAAIAKNFGCRVTATTRRPEREAMLKDNGADHVIIDKGEIADHVRKLGGVNKVLELVGTVTLADSLRCVNENGIVCMTGIVGNSWTLDKFSPFEAVPTTACLTTYQGGNEDLVATPFTKLLKQIEDGHLKVVVGKTFPLTQIVDAHRAMEQDKAGGKIVLLM